MSYGIDEYINIAILGGGQLDEPTDITEALQSKRWKEAAVSEYQSLVDNVTGELVELPSGCKPIGCKPKLTKIGSDGKVE